MPSFIRASYKCIRMYRSYVFWYVHVHWIISINEIFINSCYNFIILIQKQGYHLQYILYSIESAVSSINSISSFVKLKYKNNCLSISLMLESQLIGPFLLKSIKGTLLQVSFAVF